MTTMTLYDDVLNVTRTLTIQTSKLPEVAKAYRIPKLEYVSEDEPPVVLTDEQRCGLLFDTIIEDAKRPIQNYRNEQRQPADISDIVG